MLRWTDPAVGVDADLVVVRTPWDYIHRRDEFLAVCRAAPAPVLNHPDVLAWNSHKGYLVELAEAGVPVVPTRLVAGGRRRRATRRRRRWRAGGQARGVQRLARRGPVRGR